MTATQYYTATSLDGYIADEHDSLDWLFEVDRAHGDDDFARFFADVGGDRNVWLVGGGGLVGQVADCSLLDEVLVGIAPVTLGGGAPLLPRRLTAADLELVDVARDKQFVRLSYRLRG